MRAGYSGAEKTCQGESEDFSRGSLVPSNAKPQSFCSLVLNPLARHRLASRISYRDFTTHIANMSYESGCACGND